MSLQFAKLAATETAAIDISNAQLKLAKVRKMDIAMVHAPFHKLLTKL